MLVDYFMERMSTNIQKTINPTTLKVLLVNLYPGNRILSRENYIHSASYGFVCSHSAIFYYIVHANFVVRKMIENMDGVIMFHC